MRALAGRNEIGLTTVQKWRKRKYISDAPMGPKAVHSSVLKAEGEAIALAFCRHTLLSLDDCLGAGVRFKCSAYRGAVMGTGDKV